MPDPTLTEIAEAIRQYAPGALPPKIDYLGRGYPICLIDTAGKFVPLPNDIARSVLVFAMVMDCPCGVQRAAHGSGPIWFVWHKDGRSQFLDDRDHNNDPLLSLYAAWRWARGIQ